MTSNG